VRNPIVGILKVEDSLGNILEEFKPTPTRVLTEQAARNINDVLSDNVARTPAYGRRSFLYFDNWDIAAKTGTTNDFRDVWVVGYTPTLAVGTWAGNNDNSPIVKKVAGFVIAPMWRAFMDEALPLIQNKKFIDPEPLPEDVNPIIAGDWAGAFAQAGGAHSILHFVDKSNPRSITQNASISDPLYQNWEYPVQLWASGVNIDSTTPSGLIPPATPTQSNILNIIRPVNNSTISPGSPLTVVVSGPDNISKVDYYLNSVFIGTSNKKPFYITIVPQSRTLPSKIKAIAHTYDSSTFVDTVTFNTQ
jgi:membrane peptidoglycan carboxypeptidase